MMSATRPTGHGHHPGGSPRAGAGALRIGDAERAEVTTELARHFAEGRLDDVEFHERTERAAAAKTRDDLDPLLADLPPAGGGPFDHPTHATGATSTRPPRRLLPVLLVIGALAWALSWSGPWGFGGWGPGPKVPFLLVAVVAFVLLRRRRRWP